MDEGWLSDWREASKKVTEFDSRNIMEWVDERGQWLTSVDFSVEYMNQNVKPSKWSQMRKTRKCAFCGKEFSCNSGSQKYCSEHCAEATKAQRKKKQQDFIKAVESVIDIASQEYLTFSKAAREGLSWRTHVP